MIRVGLIGCGFISGLHLDAYERLRAAGRNVEVAGVADVRGNLAAAMGRKYAIDNVETDYRHLLDDSSIRAVDVCAPSPAHREIAVAAAEAGKHVFLEKPIALNLDDADAIICACERAGVTLMVGQSHRFEAVNQEVKCMVDSGEIGTPWYASSTIVEGYFWPGAWEAWQINPEQSGGNLVQNGVHEIDFYCGLFEEVPTRIFVRGRRLGSSHLDTFDYWHMVLSFESGRTALSTYSYSIVPPDAAFRAIYVLGSEGEGRYDSTSNGTLWRSAGATNAATLEPQQFYLELGAFLESVEAGTVPVVTPSQARLALELALVAERSARSGEPIDLPERSYG